MRKKRVGSSVGLRPNNKRKIEGGLSNFDDMDFNLDSIFDEAEFE